MIGLVLVVVGAMTATVVAHDTPDLVPPGAVVTEDGPPAVDTLAEDPEGRSGVPAAVVPDPPQPPTYVPGRASLIEPTSELGRRLNPDGDPNVRLCRNADGTITVIHAYPVPGRDPFPNAPDELRRRPC